MKKKSCGTSIDDAGRNKAEAESVLKADSVLEEKDKISKPSGRRKPSEEKKKAKLSLQFRFTMMVMADILCVFAINWLLSVVLKLAFHYTMDISILTLFFIISFSIGYVIAYFIGRDLLVPIRRLGEAMNKVAAGDFDVRLDEKSSYREVENINANFNLMASELGATEVLQTDFISNVSHEFKTPISAIEGYATLLQGCTDSSGEESEYIKKILYNTKRLSALVGNILLLSKVDNQVIQSKRSYYRLDEQVRRSIISLEPVWEPKELDISAELESIEYYGNEELLMQVFDNLIGNAVKFSPKGGSVTVGLFERNDRVIFTVLDRGPGIPEEAIKHIFDRFYQADSSHKEEGNGLGLAIVSGILELVGGSVRAQNREGGGAAFTVELPIDKKS